MIHYTNNNTVEEQFIQNFSGFMFVTMKSRYEQAHCYYHRHPLSVMSSHVFIIAAFSYSSRRFHILLPLMDIISPVLALTYLLAEVPGVASSKYSVSLIDVYSL